MEKPKSKMQWFLVVGAGLILLAVSAFLYPSILNHIAKKQQQRTIAAYDQAMAAYEDEALEDIWSEVHQYNLELMEEEMMQIVNGEVSNRRYEELLCMDENGMMGYLEIPTIDTILPIYHGTGEAALSDGCGHLEGSTLPEGARGHVVLSSHNGYAKRLFTDLPKLQIGDRFALHVLNRTFLYEVEYVETILPSDTASQFRFFDGDYVTLFTCVPYGINSHRLLVRGKRVTEESDTQSTTECTVELEKEPGITTEVTSKVWPEKVTEAVTTEEMVDETVDETGSESESTAELESEAEPASEPESEPTSEPASEPVSKPVSKPASESSLDAFTAESKTENDIDTSFQETQKEEPVISPISPTAIQINGMEIAKRALAYYGLPYVYGGNSLTDGTDCSGFTSLIYQSYGICLPRTAAEQSTMGYEISAEEAKVGDLVAVAYSSSIYTGHAGIYLGNGKMISAYPDGQGGGSVVITDVEIGMHYRQIFINCYEGSNPYQELQQYSFSLGLYGTCLGGLLKEGVPYLYGVYPVGDCYTFDLLHVPAGYEGLVANWKEQYQNNHLTYQVEQDHMMVRYNPSTKEYYTSADYVEGRVSEQDWQNAVKEIEGVFW